MAHLLFEELIHCREPSGIGGHVLHHPIDRLPLCFLHTLVYLFGRFLSWVYGRNSYTSNKGNHQNDQHLVQSNEVVPHVSTQLFPHIGDGFAHGANGDAAHLGNLFHGKSLVVEQCPHFTLSRWQVLDARLQPKGVLLLFQFLLWCGGERHFIEADILQFYLSTLSAPHAHTAIAGNAHDKGLGDGGRMAHIPHTQPCLLHHLFGLHLRTEELVPHPHQLWSHTLHQFLKLLFAERCIRHLHFYVSLVLLHTFFLPSFADITQIPQDSYS